MPLLAGLALACLLALPAASSEVVDVRMGRHPGFTRVVFELDLESGYQLSREDDLVLVTFDADAAPESLFGSHPAIESVRVDPAEGGSVARIRLRRPDLPVQEMLLADPPRVVVDVSIDPDDATRPAAPAAMASEVVVASASDLPEVPAETGVGAEVAPPDSPSESPPRPAGAIPGPTASAAASRSVAPARPARLPASAETREDFANHAFTGFQMDDETQYFAYLGLKREALWEGLGLEGFAQLFGAAQSYEYESAGRDIDADLQMLTPSLGVSRAFGDGAWNVSVLAGPRFEWKREDGFAYGSRSDFDVGLFAQAEALYWRESGSLQGLASYASTDDFFYGRLRGKLLAWSPASGCCSLFAGMDVAGMGNRDFDAVQTGPLLEVPVGRFFLLGRGGYQHDSNFGSGAYGGVEIYAPF